ncbi:uncharacterized protein METZ01_LOCUS486799, partial [marine metagenome]
MLISSFLISSIFSINDTNIESFINNKINTLKVKLNDNNSNRDATVEAGSFYFSPQDLVIEVGEMVNWINVGGMHNVDGTTNAITGEPWNNPEDFYLDIVNVANGADPVDMGSITFNVPGLYN